MACRNAAVVDTELFDYLYKRSNEVDTKQTVKDLLISIHTSSGYAHYLILVDKPLTAMHIPFNNTRRLPSARERLMDADYIRHVTRISRAWIHRDIIPKCTQVYKPVRMQFNSLTQKWHVNDVCEV